MTDNNKPENTRGSRTPDTRSDDATATAESQQPSLASRVQSSAAGLARALGSSTSDAAQTLASATEGKTAGPSAGTGTGTGAGHLSSGSVAPRGAGSASSRSGPSESFREAPATTVQGGFTIPALNEEEFQQGYKLDTQYPTANTYTDTPTLDPAPNARTSHDLDLQTQTGPWKGKQRAHDPIQREYSTAWERAQSHPQSQPTQATYEPNANDGAEVVTLLSDSTFDPNIDPYNADLDLDVSVEPEPLSAGEIKALESFRKGLGSEGQTQIGSEGQGRGLSGMSLVPDIDTFLAQDTSSDVGALRDSVLEHLPGASDWVGVQDRYHDEVWGYLRPALEAAKAEMEEGGEGEGQGHEDGPAVRRLRMILEHMR